MIAQKIYNYLSVIIILALLAWIFTLYVEINETNEVLEQCSDRYYEVIDK